MESRINANMPVIGNNNRQLNNINETTPAVGGENQQHIEQNRNVLPFDAINRPTMPIRPRDMQDRSVSAFGQDFNKALQAFQKLMLPVQEALASVFGDVLAKDMLRFFQGIPEFKNKIDNHEQYKVEVVLQEYEQNVTDFCRSFCGYCNEHIIKLFSAIEDPSFAEISNSHIIKFCNRSITEIFPSSGNALSAELLMKFAKCLIEKREEKKQAIINKYKNIKTGIMQQCALKIKELKNYLVRENSIPEGELVNEALNTSGKILHYISEESKSAVTNLIDEVEQWTNEVLDEWTKVAMRHFKLEEEATRLEDSAVLREVEMRYLQLGTDTMLQEGEAILREEKNAMVREETIQYLTSKSSSPSSRSSSPSSRSSSSPLSRNRESTIEVT